MEARKKRKALSDCTNTIVNTTTTSSSSSSIKKPSLASAFKRVLANDSGKTVVKSHSTPGSTAVTTNENGSESATENPSSSVVIASTPRKSSLVSGTSEREVVEPCSVYSRRRTADRRKSKGKTVVSSPAVSSIATGDNKEDKVTGPPKSCTVRHKKTKKDDPVHDMPQDFIEKQRAYFAEVDAFELPEEEVETIDQLE